MSAVRIRTEGRPAPKGSRTQHKTKAGKVFTRPASKFETPWVKAVAASTQIAMRHHPLLAPPYAIEVEIIVSKPKRSSYPWPSQHDVDKLARATIDGLVKGGALADDRHVIELIAAKRYANNGEPPGALAIVASVPPP